MSSDIKTEMTPEVQSSHAPNNSTVSDLPSLFQPVLRGYKWALDGMEEHLNAARFSPNRNIASILLKRSITKRLESFRSKFAANDAVSLGGDRKLGLLIRKLDAWLKDLRKPWPLLENSTERFPINRHISLGTRDTRRSLV